LLCPQPIEIKSVINTGIINKAVFQHLNLNTSVAHSLFLSPNVPPFKGGTLVLTKTLMTISIKF
jgi:hypothetical protein